MPDFLYFPTTEVCSVGQGLVLEEGEVIIYHRASRTRREHSGKDGVLKVVERPEPKILAAKDKKKAQTFMAQKKKKKDKCSEADRESLKTKLRKRKTTLMSLEFSSGSDGTTSPTPINTAAPNESLDVGAGCFTPPEVMVMTVPTKGPLKHPEGVSSIAVRLMFQSTVKRKSSSLFRDMMIHLDTPAVQEHQKSLHDYLALRWFSLALDHTKGPKEGSSNPTFMMRGASERFPDEIGGKVTGTFIQLSSLSFGFRLFSCGQLSYHVDHLVNMDGVPKVINSVRCGVAA
ncbi:hypothetical protein Tco_0564585 [Tanacetum coccineum]